MPTAVQVDNSYELANDKCSLKNSTAGKSSRTDCTSESGVGPSIAIPMISGVMMTATNSEEKTFPELLEAYRISAKKSKDSAFQYGYITYLLDVAEKIEEAPAALGIHFDPDYPQGPTEMRTFLEAEAVKWLKKLATRPHVSFPEAQFLLADFYGRGVHGLKVEHSKAFGLYLQASKLNHPGATYRVAVCYEMGAGVKKDEARALQFYRKASASGEPLAMHKYALMLLYGQLGCKQSVKEGVSWLKRAAAMATALNPQSLVDLARLYEKDSGCSAVIPDEAYARELYEKAAFLGYSSAQYRIGTCHEFQLLGCAFEPKTALKWYAKAADQGFAEAELALSHWYLTGTPATALDSTQPLEPILRPSASEAFAWAQRAADHGLPKAQYTLGYYYEEGIGCVNDFATALMWYRRSASEGYHRAIKRLKELKQPLRPKKHWFLLCG